ncbi:MAG: serine hydrolase domain-containing protein [Candidatus Saccharicenans sp.]|nr:serine hydrolase domain-containing protein [Candidatus Saccharicenans sp.]
MTDNNKIRTVVVFPGTEVGKKAEEFWKAFDRSEDAGLEAFFSQNLPAEKLQQAPASERTQRLLDLRQRLGKELKLIEVIQQSPEEISLFIERTKNQLFKLTLVFEKTGGKFWLKALSLDEAGPEDLAPPLPPMRLAEALVAIERQIEKAVQEDSFSGVVLIARHFQPIFFRSYGFASKEFRVPNRTDTRFNLGSINKIFTRIAIGQMAEQGWLNLDDKLEKFLPEYPNAEAREKVTVRHLVNMTSGIGDFFGPEFNKTPKNFLRHNRDYLKLFAHKPLAFEPGTREMYSNGGYVLLGEIISAASGMDYYDFINRNIFEPAGMKDSGWFQADAVVENVAEGYTRVNEETEPGSVISGQRQTPARPEESEKPVQTIVKSLSGQEKERIRTAEQTEKNVEKIWRRNIYTRPARGSAAGGVYAPAEDLLRFVRALFENRLLSEAWTDWVFTGIEPATAAVKTDREKIESKNKNDRSAAILDKNPGAETMPAKSDPSSATIKGGVVRVSNQKEEVQIKPDRSRWNLAIAGGAPGINAVLEFEAATGYTIIVLSNYDPPAAIQISRMIRRHIKAVSS